MLRSCDSYVIKVLSQDPKLSKREQTIAGLHSNGEKMPRCFVERCHNYGGKRLNIILHSFPNNLDKIRTWLRCIEQSGHVVRDMEELAERIFEGKTNNRFRVCSEHFTEQSYQPSGLRKTLRKDAVPTIFRDVPPQKCPWQKVKPALKRPQMDPSGGPHRRTFTSQQSHQQSVFRPVPMNPSVLDHQPCGPVNMETTIKTTEYFQHKNKETKERYRMDIPHVILNLTLEIICLLTGEDYIVVKKTSSHSKGCSRIQGPIIEPPPDSLVSVKNNEQKILDLANKIIELLTGEKCDYTEDHHNDIMIESHQALSSLGNMVNGLSNQTSAHIIAESSSCEEKEDVHTTDHKQQHLFSNIKAESVTCDRKNITDSNTYKSIAEIQHYSSTPIKEEPFPSDDGSFTDPEIYATTDHAPQHASHHIKDEKGSSESADPDTSTSITPTHQYSSIKEETVTDRGGNLTDVYIPSDHIHSPTSIEEAGSCDGGSITNPTDLAPQHPSNVLDGPELCDEGRAINTDKYTEAQSSSTHTEIENEDVQNNYSLFDKGNLDTDIYALIKHAQAKYTFIRIEDGSSSEEDYPKDHTRTPADHCQQRPPTDAEETVPQTFQCPDCSECFTRKSGLINHRRNHRQEKLTCSKCGKVFSKRSSLQNHLTLHTGEKPYACPICGKCFARKSNLISHETIHSGKASFICAECGRYFVCKVHLTKHQIIHEK
ncbi:uncharacterized protein [Dendrobates tinctorius]|uniref:uncharacterized protein isoform X2 n=1 Tax=Dendrobates tinctorius TaxID=92724 RepID=UPI003CCA0F65